MSSQQTAINTHVHFVLCIQLHCPQDESVTCFWVDFNTGSSSVTVYVDDPLESDGETQDNVWEMVTIREAVVNNWTVKGIVYG